MIKISKLKKSCGQQVIVLHDESSLDIDPGKLDFDLFAFAYDDEYIRWNPDAEPFSSLTIRESILTIKYLLQSRNQTSFEIKSLRMITSYLRGDALDAIV